MREGLHLSEALNLECPHYERGRLNLIVAQTGQGKTTAAINTIPKQLGVAPQRCLILIDTTMGEEEKIALDECQMWGEKLDKPYILNYQKFGAMVKRGELVAEMFDYICCDEIHNLIKYVRIDEANIWKRNPESSREVICLILSQESFSYIAIDTLLHWAELKGVWWFGLTATADNLEKWTRLKSYINEIQIQEQLIAYEVFQKYEYSDVHVLLRANPEVKRLIFVPKIEQGEQFAREIQENTGRKVVCLWSRRALKPMTNNQLDIVNHLQQSHKYPDDIDDIILTEAYATGWNLIDDNVQIVIVHSGNKDIQIQFPGRKRGDWQVQYNYNSKLAENKKRLDRKQVVRANIANTQWIIPDNYLNRKLGKEDKGQLIQEIGYPKKWTSFKKDIQEYYNVEQSGTGAYYGHIITKK
jgi:hypothetical protein